MQHERTLPATKDLTRLLTPSAIALVGASSNPKTVGGQPLRYMKEFGYQGKLYPVNPNRKEVQGLPCYDSVLSIPETCDVAVVTVPAPQVAGVIRECGTARIPFAIVLSAGFQDAGMAGAEPQNLLQRAIMESGVRVVGPNSTGVVNLMCRAYCGQGGALSDPALRPGSIAIVSQSGGVGLGMLAFIQGAGIGTNFFISSGNEIDLDVFDFVEHLLELAHVSCIALYLESSTAGRRIRTLGRRALASGKPIVVLKVGNAGTARAAATSHTGRLTANYELFRTAFRESGYVEVRELDELVDVLRTLGGRLPVGKRAAILTTSGGWGVMMAESCEQHGLMLPAPTAQTSAALAKIAPSYATLRNPIDVTPQGYGDQYADFDAMARHLLADSQMDMLIVRSATGGDMATWAKRLIQIAEHSTKAVLVNWAPAPGRFAEEKALLESHGIPCISYAGRLAQAAAACADFAIKRRHLQSAMGSPQPASIESIRLTLRETPGSMGEHASKQCLRAYRIPTTKELLVRPEQLEVMDLRGIKYPVAVKAVSDDLQHKTEAGGVLLNLKSEFEVRHAAGVVLEQVRAYAPHASIEGISIQEMASGVEVILGAVADPHFGPYVMFGIGGIFAEILRDVTYRYAPVTVSEAREMVMEVRARQMFEGFRGQLPRDMEALSNAIANLSRLIWDHQDRISEVEINPLFVGAMGTGVVAADALIVVK